MKLTYASASPFARKVRIAAIELGLIDKIELVPVKIAPGEPNDQYMHDINPVKKLPALILDNGEVIVDSYVIVEYLDELAGGKLIPAAGPTRWQVKSNHSILQGMLDSMLLCRYEALVRPQGLKWQAWSDDHWNRAWQGMAHFENKTDVLNGPFDIAQISLICVLGYADFRFADKDWRTAYPKLAAFHEKMLQRPSVSVSLPTAA